MSSVQFSGRRRLLAAATLAALAAVSAGGFYLRSSSAGTKPAAPASSPAPPVPVATLAETQGALWDEFSGRLEAVERVDVRSRVAGAVQTVHFREGVLVGRGGLLITIDPATHHPGAGRRHARVR